MSKKYKMAVGNVIRVPVEGACNNEDGQKTKFKFSLRCTRLSATDLAAALASRDDLAKDFLISVTTDWKVFGSRSILLTWPTTTPPIFTGALARNWPSWVNLATSG